MITQKKFNRLVKMLKTFINNNNVNSIVIPDDIYTEFHAAKIWKLWTKRVQDEIKGYSTLSLMTARKAVINDFIKDCQNHIIGK